MVVEVKVPAMVRIEKQGINLHLEEFDKYEVEKELKSAEGFVEEVLKKELIARNSDVWLLFLVWLRQGLAKYVEVDGKHGYFVPIQNLRNLIPAETITRVRRVLNEQGKYLPTDPKVQARRKTRERQFKEVLAKKWLK